MKTATTSEVVSFEDFKKEVINDYKIARISRECSLLGRKEVLTGKAKFGIFGDGKEVPQLALAKAFQNGDFRSGYYRDQTFMMAIGAMNIEQFFAGLYGHTDINFDPMSAGRQMGGHFATHSLDENGNWKNLTQQKNSSSDISPTAGQMPRLLGLAQASKIYRNVSGINQTNFSENGNEVAWGTIGNASTSEGLFFETKCNTCNSTGLKNIEERIEVDIPSGIAEGMTFVMSGKGHGIKGGECGDLHIKIFEIPHKTFTRSSNGDLKMNLKLTYTQLVLGDKVEVETIDGGKIRIPIPEFSDVGDNLRVPTKGLKQFEKDTRGDLTITLGIDMPKVLNESEREILDSLKIFEKKRNVL